mmetsp:Transcript_77642/g.222472  ORF Transcript_77642/g.222472 Transcript_77642/m.222472 type:complete len:170 (-) Transcript_77642:66-575(-)
MTCGHGDDTGMESRGRGGSGLALITCDMGGMKESEVWPVSVGRLGGGERMACAVLVLVLPAVLPADSPKGPLPTEVLPTLVLLLVAGGAQERLVMAPFRSGVGGSCLTPHVPAESRLLASGGPGSRAALIPAFMGAQTPAMLPPATAGLGNAESDALFKAQEACADSVG